MNKDASFIFGIAISQADLILRTLPGPLAAAFAGPSRLNSMPASSINLRISSADLDSTQLTPAS
jgi:hypothetical protein